MFPTRLLNDDMFRRLIAFVAKLRANLPNEDVTGGILMGTSDPLYKLLRSLSPGSQCIIMGHNLTSPNMDSAANRSGKPTQAGCLTSSSLHAYSLWFVTIFTTTRTEELTSDHLRFPSIIRERVKDIDTRVARLAFWLLPDAAIVHKPDLALNYFLAVFSMFHGLSLQI